MTYTISMNPMPINTAMMMPKGKKMEKKITRTTRATREKRTTKAKRTRRIMRMTMSLTLYGMVVKLPGSLI